MKLEVGEKYIRIKILDGIYVSAFKNKEKKNPNEPDYAGNGVAVWITAKKEPSPKTEVVDL